MKSESYLFRQMCVRWTSEKLFAERLNVSTVFPTVHCVLTDSKWLSKQTEDDTDLIKASEIKMLENAN